MLSRFCIDFIAKELTEVGYTQFMTQIYPIIKFILLQSLWFILVLYGNNLGSLSFVVGLLCYILNFYWIRKVISLGHYLFCAFSFLLYGFIQDFGASKLELIDYSTSYPPSWLGALFLVFLCYYGDIFDYLSRLSLPVQALLGFWGGGFAYYSGAQLAELTILSPLYYLYIALGWSVFFPLSLRIFYKGLGFHLLLDASIYYSFDRRGFLRHKKKFPPELLEFNSNSYCLITGGSSGIGKALGESLKGKLGVIITGRNETKGFRAAKEINAQFKKLDMENWQEIESFVQRLPVLDYLVLNAGAMPDKLLKHDSGIESQMASQLFGHYYLLKSIVLRNKLAAKARVIWVTSGGMYLAPLDLKKVMADKIKKYDKMATYANVKRAQVDLLEFFAQEFSDYSVVAMHPGWVDTPALSGAMEDFYKSLGQNLRTPQEGADTIYWLMGSKNLPQSGKLYFDRARVRKHYFPHTFLFNDKAESLYKLLQTYKPNL